MDDDKSTIRGGVIAEKCNDDRHYREWDASVRQRRRKREREKEKKDGEEQKRQRARIRKCHRQRQKRGAKMTAAAAAATRRAQEKGLRVICATLRGAE